MRQAFSGLASKTVRSVSAALAVSLAVSASALPAHAANAKFAAIVVDANTGKTLYSASADSPRFPASLTKMMTLYLTFEALKAGRIAKRTPVPFSAQAAAMPPTKLGIGAGRSVAVETCVLALVTKSANDCAAALGELLGGSEQRFALMMTQKARGLGMSGTEFHNASGLPNPEQHTTARDMARLGLALRRDFPQYYAYFSTPSFTFGKRRMPNHNKLLGRVRGVDGIKTGYTNASGYNLVSSVTDGNKRLVAVVLGGVTGRARDDQMAALIKQYLPLASGRAGVGDALIASAARTPQPIARRDEAPVAALEEAEAPRPVRTTPKEARFAKAIPASRPSDDEAAVDPVETASVSPKGWSIQVASAPSQVGAKLILTEAGRVGGKALASASPYTVAFKKGRATFYRARFGGFKNRDAASSACATLTKQRVECFPIQN